MVPYPCAPYEGAMLKRLRLRINFGKNDNFEIVLKIDTRPTFCTCLIRFTDMKWIGEVLWNIQSGQTDKMKTVENGSGKYCKWFVEPAQWTHDVILTSLLRQNDVSEMLKKTSHATHIRCLFDNGTYIKRIRQVLWNIQGGQTDKM